MEILQILFLAFLSGRLHPGNPCASRNPRDISTFNFQFSTFNFSPPAARNPGNPVNPLSLISAGSAASWKSLRFA
jgi:hypothetical protein